MRHVESKANVRTKLQKATIALGNLYTRYQDAAPSILSGDAAGFGFGVGKAQMNLIYNQFGSAFIKYLDENKCEETMRALKNGKFSMMTSVLRRAQLTGIMVRESMINHLEKEEKHLNISMNVQAVPYRLCEEHRERSRVPVFGDIDMDQANWSELPDHIPPLKRENNEREVVLNAYFGNHDKNNQYQYKRKRRNAYINDPQYEYLSPEQIDDALNHGFAESLEIPKHIKGATDMDLIKKDMIVGNEVLFVFGHSQKFMSFVERARIKGEGSKKKLRVYLEEKLCNGQMVEVKLEMRPKFGRKSKKKSVMDPDRWRMPEIKSIKTVWMPSGTVTLSSKYSLKTGGGIPIM